MSETQHAPLGELLIQHGGMSDDHLRAALEEQRATGRPLGEIVVERGYVPAAMVAQALATQQGGLTKTEYGYATGWVQAIDERDRTIAELRRWVESAQAAIEARDAEIERLGGEAVELQAAVESRDAEIVRLAAESEEVERLVAGLRDEVAAASARADEAERLAVPPDPWATTPTHLVFVRRTDGYELVERDGPPPAPGDPLDGGIVQRVAGLGGKPCAYVID